MPVDDAKKNSRGTGAEHSRRLNNIDPGLSVSKSAQSFLTPKHIVDANKMASKPLVVQKKRNISHYTEQKSGIYVPETDFGNIKPFSKESILLGIQRRSQFIGECCELKRTGKVLVRSCRLVD